MSTVTRKQAEAVFALVEKRYAVYLSDVDKTSPDYPKLVQNWTSWYSSNVVPWAILGGSYLPDEWAYLFSMGGIDDEVACLMVDELGLEEAKKHIKPEEPAIIPKGISMECGSSDILCLYPE